MTFAFLRAALDAGRFPEWRREGQSKSCTRCGTDKPMDQFYDYHRGAFGKHPACIVCMRSDNRARYYRRKARG